jgi:hypothetical protein
VFTHPSIAREFARQRHRDFIVRADRRRLSRLSHSSMLPAWPRLRASLLRWVLRLRGSGRLNRRPGAAMRSISLARRYPRTSRW